MGTTDQYPCREPKSEMPPQGKRSWDATDDNEMGSSKDYPVCDQCRSRKIRCGRERPHCSNCTRLGLECEWLGQGKRPNQTIWLSHAVNSLGDRLEKLENAVSGLQSSMDSRSPETTPFQATTPPPSSSSRPYGRRCSIRNVGGHERYYGSTSLVSLIQDMAAVIQANLCNADQETSGADAAFAAAAREELLQLTEAHDVYRRVSDGSILTSPPRVIIEAMIDPYFDMVNPHMPIWTKDGFRKLMSSTGHLFDASKRRAYDVCANNLVLLTLQAKSLHSRATSSALSTPFTETPTASSIDGDLIKSFIVNAKRALENVELLLLSPSLLSLQALLSLCLVAQTSLSEDVIALLFSLAVHVAKSIGLHQWDSNQQDAPSTSESEDRRNVMYCMLSLSRAVPWSSGLSSTMLGIDVLERDLRSHSVEDSASRLAARVSLCKLEEQVYSSLYSDQATRKNPGETRKMASGLGRKLQDWAMTHADDLGESQERGTATLAYSQPDLAIRFYSIQALGEWPLIGNAEASHSLLDISRRALGLFQHVWRTTSEKGHYLTLALLVASYPAVAFFELSRHVLCSQQVATEDLELLRSFVSMVHTFADWAEENSYMKRLSKFGSIILQLTNCRRENTSSHSSGADSTPPRPFATAQAYMHTMGIYPGAATSSAEIYGGGSAGSSSTHSNSTPISGGMQPRRTLSDTETAAAPETSTAAISSSLGSFDGAFDGELTPMDELEGWIVDPRLGDTIRPSLQPNQMTGFMLQDNNGYTFSGIELG
ncbi:hypothetical protein B0T10DRAFT_491043 [Thelonectria olida]|uniref:Zn(2)-C6 fungal-type domain-containing protein n=1 Tax=Thelonectria olida TaxID=1576542 RepID=A0A9P8W2S3_9HYPO|nr:hypothetical protein B0T10DRAFT_491043 [Thelonectria olida]